MVFLNTDLAHIYLLTDTIGTTVSPTTIHPTGLLSSRASPATSTSYLTRRGDGGELQILNEESDRPKRRAKSEIFCDILKVISQGTTRPTKIQQRANLTWNHLLLYLDILIRNGFATREMTGRVASYGLTPKGKTVVELSTSLRELIWVLDFTSIVDDKRLAQLKAPTVGDTGWKSRLDEKAGQRPYQLDTSKLAGKNILLEVDPCVNYELGVTKMVEDFMSMGDRIYLFSWKGSPVYENLSGKDKVHLCIMDSSVSSRKEGKNKEEVMIPENDQAVLFDEMSKAAKSGSNGGVLLVFDSISDLILSESLPTAYHMLKTINGLVSGTKTTIVSILRQHAHDEQVESTIKGIYAYHLLYSYSGLRLIRSG
jgi:predicted transcriptional regulator